MAVDLNRKDVTRFFSAFMGGAICVPCASTILCDWSTDLDSSELRFSASRILLLTVVRPVSHHVLRSLTDNSPVLCLSLAEAKHQEENEMKLLRELPVVEVRVRCV